MTVLENLASNKASKADVNILLISVSVMRDNSHKLMVHGNQICRPPPLHRLLIDRTRLSESEAACLPAPFDLFADALQVISSLPSVLFSSAVITV